MSLNMRYFHLTTLLVLALSTDAIPALPAPAPYTLPKRLITLEEHSVAPSLEADILATNRLNPDVVEKLKDLGAGRIADMDAGHVSMQVLSQQPSSGLEDPEGCRKANDAVRAAVTENPDRFAGFAVLPTSLPDQAAVELNRTVTTLGFKGAMIWNHLRNGTYYDAARFDPIFAMAQSLDVPLYLHPAAPTAEIASKLFVGNYPANLAERLGMGAWGWHIDVGTHVLRLYSAGLFDRFPNLKVILGHNGEGLPMFLDRIDSRLRGDASFSRVWEQNIWITTSGPHTVRHFQQLRQVTSVERIMYSVDYPFTATTTGWAFVEKLAQSGTLSDEEMNAFAYKNAERLLKL